MTISKNNFVLFKELENLKDFSSLKKRIGGR